MVIVIVALIFFAPASPLYAQLKDRQRISPPVRTLLSEIEARGITRANARAMNVTALSTPLVRVDEDGRVQIYVYLSTVSESVLSTLLDREVDIEIVNDGLGIVQAWAPFDRIKEISELTVVRRITSPSYGVPRAGSMKSEGDAVLKSDLLRQLGLDGSGVKVGVISDGANDWITARASGDLPANITAFGTCSPEPFDGPTCSFGKTCNEGTAMLEIIHDIAPGAQLAIGSANTSLEFAQRVDELVNTFGADVVVDDLGFVGEPFFADGIVAQAVAAVSDLIVYISAAGNSAQSHYESDYRPDLSEGFDLHNFGQVAGGSTDLSMNVLVGPGEFVFPVLQWNDPFAASSNDYDLFLFDDTETDFLCESCASVLEQSGAQDPIEGFCYFNNSGSTVRGKLVVNKFSGGNKRIELFLIGGFIEEYGVPEGSVFGQAGLPDVIAVGAIDVSDDGHDDIESFSSRGPARIDFPASRVTPKPDVAAVDGVSVTGAGGFPSVFFGTSAAAPHVAGIAALLKQQAPGAAPREIRAALRAGAFDLGAVGPDGVFGWGRAEAIAAHRVLATGAILTSSSNQLRELLADGTLIRSVPSPPQVGSNEQIRDLTVNSAGEIFVFNGTFNPVLSINFPPSDTWSGQTHPDWDTANNLSYGGIAVTGKFAFVTDMGPEGSRGIIRFDSEAMTSTRFATNIEPIDLNLGLDGLLYALFPGGSPEGRFIDVYDPGTLAFRRTISLAAIFGHTGHRSVAINGNGEIYVADWDGDLQKIDAAGNVLNQVNLCAIASDCNAVDVDVSTTGQVMVGFRFGSIVSLDQDLSSPSVFSTGTQNVFLALPRSAVDSDGDGTLTAIDNCPGIRNFGQHNADGDSQGDLCDPDDDNDQLPDDFELAVGLNPFDSADSALDNDDDGLSNLEEFQLGTGVNVFDSDVDGVGDGDEIATGRNPLVNEFVILHILNSINFSDD